MDVDEWILFGARTEITQDRRVRLSVRLAQSEEHARKNQLVTFVLPMDEKTAMSLGEQIVLAAREVNRMNWADSAGPAGPAN